MEEESLAQGPACLGLIASNGGLLHPPVPSSWGRPHAKPSPHPQMLTWQRVELALPKVNIKRMERVLGSLGSSSFCFFFFQAQKDQPSTEEAWFGRLSKPLLTFLSFNQNTGLVEFSSKLHFKQLSWHVICNISFGGLFHIKKIHHIL